MRSALWGAVGFVVVATISVPACEADHDCNETGSCSNAANSHDGGGLGDQAVQSDAAGNNETGANDGGTGDFSIAIEQRKVELTLGKATPIAVSIARSAAVSEDLFLSVEGLPAGLTSNAVVAGPNDDRVTLSVAALVDAAQGPSTVVVTARSLASKIQKQVPLDLFVRGRPGQLDTTFAKGGYAETHIAGVHSNFYDMTVLTDDAIVAVGSIGVGAIQDNKNNGFALAKYYASGQPHQSFGTNGAFSGPIVADELATVVLDQAAKGVVVGGNSPQGFVLRRYSLSGPVDQAFGIGGEAREPSRDRYFGSIKLLAHSGGKFVAVGSSINASRHYEFTAIRYTADGQVDSTFGSAGYAFTPSTECDLAHDALVLADGRIVISGETYPCTSPSDRSGMIVRLTAAGQPDSTFGTAGKAIVAQSPVQSALALSGERLLLLHSLGGGAGSSRITVLTPNGTEDPSSAPKTAVLALNGSHLLRQPDGKIVSFGTFSNQVGLVRLLDDLSLDANFGSGGYANISSSGLLQIIQGAFQSDGRLVVAAGKYEASVFRFWVARIWM